MPRRPSFPSRASRPSISGRSNPWPLSVMESVTSSGPKLTSTLAEQGPACFSTLRSASWAILNSTSSDSVGNRRGFPSTLTEALAAPLCVISAATHSMAGSSPRSSRIEGRRSRLNRRTFSKTESAALRISSSFSLGPPSWEMASRPRQRRTSDWAVSSCSSRAMRVRSSS